MEKDYPKDNQNITHQLINLKLHALLIKPERYLQSGY